MTERDNLTIRFEGDAGDGVISMGLLAARTAARMGYHVYTYSTFLAVVRGGQSTFQLRIGINPLLSQGDHPDLLVALNAQAVRNHALDVLPGGLMLHPPMNGDMPGDVPDQVGRQEINFEERAVIETGQARGKNMVALGATLRLLGLDGPAVMEAAAAMFASKGPEVADLNARAIESGFHAVNRSAKAALELKLAETTPIHRMLLSGNEAVALGALAGGIRFFAGYPITPASEIMEWLAKHLPRVGGRMVQAEDEIASLAMCIGASFGGVKSMTATSGPGLSLMSELIGLAGMMETPVVIVDVQRAGPSTGMPTKEGQGDLNIATHGVHGEVPRVVLAPQTVSDCFEQTIQAVNIAHEYHIPVLLLSSQSLSHRMQTITPPKMDEIDLYREPMLDPATINDKPFERFAPTADGRPSIRSIPGIPDGMFRAGGLEHDEIGNPCFEPAIRRRMVRRRRERMKAIQRAFRESDGVTRILDNAPLGVISWGSSASVTQEAIERMTAHDWRISYFFPNVLWPMPDLALEKFLASGIQTLFVVELNATRQFGKMIRSRYTVDLVEHDIRVIGITKDDGMPFTPEEIESRITDHVSEMLSQRGLPFSPRTIRERIFGDSQRDSPAIPATGVQS
jgi:2-oxoglutarate ferredoxin oxidoreductase subunit alpha